MSDLDAAIKKGCEESQINKDILSGKVKADTIFGLTIFNDGREKALLRDGPGGEWFEYTTQGAVRA